MKEYIIAHGDVKTAVKELIRCKDCRYYNPFFNNCDVFCDYLGYIPVEEDDYCSRAERKEE